MAFANTAPRQIDPIGAASIVSFGFVYIHPFVDGNGRLSRFLFRKALLPVSVVAEPIEDAERAAKEPLPR